MTPPAALETRNLCRNFGSLAATRDVSLIFERGRRYAIIGPNGAGKTTFFNLLAGNLRPDTGTVLLDGQDVTKLDFPARARLGLGRSFQRNNLFLENTVRENLALALNIKQGGSGVFWRSMRGRSVMREGAEAAAERVGLADSLDVPVRFLSYGTQRQLEVGLALAGEPTVLLLDEPTAGMSPEETAGMHALIAGLPGSLTMIIIEHDMDIVMDLAHRIIVLDYGSVLAEGAPDDIRGSETVRQRYLGERGSATSEGSAA